MTTPWGGTPIQGRHPGGPELGALNIRPAAAWRVRWERGAAIAKARPNLAAMGSRRGDTPSGAMRNLPGAKTGRTQKPLLRRRDLRKISYMDKDHRVQGHRFADGLFDMFTATPHPGAGRRISPTAGAPEEAWVGGATLRTESTAVNSTGRWRRDGRRGGRPVVVGKIRPNKVLEKVPHSTPWN